MKIAREILRGLKNPGNKYGEGIARRAKHCVVVQFAVQPDSDQLGRPHAYVLGGVVCSPPHGTGRLHKVEARLYPPHQTLPTWLSCDCGNFRYCVSPDTLVNTEHGLVPIKHLEGAELQAWTRDQHQDAKIISAGKATTVRVRTTRGYALRATENERLLVLHPDLTLDWKRVDELVAGDHVMLQPGYARTGDPVPIDFQFVPNVRESYFRTIGGKRTEVSGHVATNYKEYTTPVRLTHDLAGVLGYLVAEGSTDKNTISFPQKDGQVMDDYLHRWARCFPDSDLSANKETNGTAIAEIRSVYLVQFLQSLGYDTNWRSGTKEVPEILFRGRLGDIREFLSCAFEGDGWCTETQVGYDSDSPKLLEQMQQLLLLFGVVTSRSDTSLWCGGVYAQRFCERIGFVSNRKNAALKREEAAGRTVPYVHSMLQSCLRPNGYYEVDGERKRLNLYHKTLQKNDQRAGGMYERTVREYLEAHPDFGVAYPDIHTRLISLLESDGEWDAVVEVGDPREEWTYDAVVPSVEHYVGNGFVVHNTWEVALTAVHSSSVKYSNGALSRVRNVKHLPAPCKHLTRFLMQAMRSRDLQKAFAELDPKAIKEVRRKKLMQQRGVPEDMRKKRPRPQIEKK